MAANAPTLPRRRFRFLTERDEIATTHKVQSIAVLSHPMQRASHRTGTITVSTKLGDEERTFTFTVEDAARIPGWLKPTLKRATRLFLLPFNWDNEGGKVIERSSVMSAITSLMDLMGDNSSLPQWLPTSEGGVQLEWHEGGIDLEIEFSADGTESHVVFADLNKPERDWHGSLASNSEKLAPIFTTRLQRKIQ